MRALLLLTLLAAGPLAWADEAAAPADWRAAARRSADAGVAFLLADQNPNGSWGGPRGSTYTFGGGMFSSPEAHRPWVVATTGLAVLALVEATDSPEATAAVDRAVDYLVANADLKRASVWETWNNWGHIYGLQALARVLREPRFADSPRSSTVRAAAELHIRKLGEFQSLNGGWTYLELIEPRTQRPQMAMSFMTAAALLALEEARAAGLALDDAVYERGMQALRRCQLPNGAYTYTVNTIPSPSRLDSINQVKGSLGRIPACDLALRLGGDPIDDERIRRGLAHFFTEHRFLDIALHRPYPHEAYYANSGYFYLFGHYYAARAITVLPPADRVACWPRLCAEVTKLQGRDGAMWDYGMHAYHKPYGTAYGVLTLAAALQDAPAPAAPPAAPPPDATPQR